MATSPHMLALIAKAKEAHAKLLAEKAAKSQTSMAEPPDSTLHALHTSAHASQYKDQNQSAQLQSKTAAAPIFTEITRISKSLPDDVELNERQLEAIERGLRGQSFVLIGAAGTGKTTVTQKLIQRIQQAAHMMPFAAGTDRLTKGAPGFVVGGYTNKAVNNIRKKLNSILQPHCMTFHKLIEFGPEYFEIIDDKGQVHMTMRFTPSRNATNPLPHVSTIFVEEASMMGIDLFAQVIAALPRSAATQFIFLGDIFQLPPVFGPSILGFKLSELPVVELTHVYRQALESPIISLATAIRTNTINSWLAESLSACASKEENQSNEMLSAKMLSAHTGKLTGNIVVDKEEHGKVTIRPWKKRLSAPSALKTIQSALIGLIKANEYDPEVDQILCPFNVSFGTIELNKGIADYLTKGRDESTWEVVGRFTKSYWAVGDKVMVDRHDAVITKIEPTVGYSGMPTRAPSKTLNRHGVDSTDTAQDQKTTDEILNELDAIAESDDEGKNLASHKITVYLPDLEVTQELTTAGEINAMILSYVLTIHKSQGSEWGRVFVILHSSHQTMCSRELLYTAFTRAKKELYIICEGDFGGYKNQLTTGAARAVVPGITLKEKIEYFKSKAASYSEMN